MSVPVKLTPRDKAILHDCYLHAVMSFAQIHKRHFTDQSRPTVSNRLGQLRNAGYLKKTRVCVLPFLDGSAEVGAVYQLTRRGLSHVRVTHPDEEIRENPHSLNHPSLAHDLLLNDALRALGMRYPDRKLVHGKLLPVARTNGSRHPDAAILDEKAQPTTAIELELTAKTDARYRAIVVQYMTSSHYKNVLYIVGGSAISDKIKYQITHQKSTLGLSVPSTGKFYFVRLQDLVTQPRQVSISNGSCELFGSTHNRKEGD